MGCEGPSDYSQSIEKDELYGEYSATFGDADTIQISLLPDSVFIASHKYQNGDNYADTGIWSFRSGSFRHYGILCKDLKLHFPRSGYCYDTNGDIDSTPTEIIFPLHKDHYGINIRSCFERKQYYAKWKIREPREDLDQ